MVRAVLRASLRSLRAAGAAPHAVHHLHFAAEAEQIPRGAIVRAGVQHRADVLGVLQATGFAEQRASKMDHDDFLLLLARFNQAGVHFSS